MRSPAVKESSTDSVDDCDDIFGPPRTYPTGYCPPKNRPSMISAKYKQKEERRKVLKISLSKLKKIEDPEASLCRSVLINNTMKRLQKETRDEKMQKQQLNYPRCYDNDNYLNIKTEFMKNERTFEEQPQPYQANNNESKIMDIVVENDFDAKLAEEINNVSAKDMEVIGSFAEENLNGLSTCYPAAKTENNDRLSSRKRSYDDIEDCDVQDVLSQFYMPPTPRMLTGIDDDEDVSVVDEEPVAKRIRSSEQSVSVTSDSDRTVCGDKNLTDFSVNNFINNNIPTTTTTTRYHSTSQNVESDSNPYSCGHASMFNELQSNVYHNLIASLET